MLVIAQITRMRVLPQCRSNLAGAALSCPLSGRLDVNHLAAAALLPPLTLLCRTMFSLHFLQSVYEHRGWWCLSTLCGCRMLSVCLCGSEYERGIFYRAVQTRSFHASAARQFNFAKYSDAVTSSEARCVCDVFMLSVLCVDSSLRFLC